MPSSSSQWAFPLVPAVSITSILLGYWLSKVNAIVPEPYLDEVFHVRQAQAYWEHRWRQWDPKITTPPGLYLISYALGTSLLLVSRSPLKLSAPDLRNLNGVALFTQLPVRLRKLLVYIRSPPKEPSDVSGSTLWDVNLVAMNISLFPPIFFFSGLYYTDLASLLFVVEVYIWDLSRDCEGPASEEAGSKAQIKLVRRPSSKDVLFVLYGLLALVFRQTNIFWVSVFLGGLRAVRTVQSLTTRCTTGDIVGVARDSWKSGQLYDPPASEASIEDYLKTTISLVLVLLTNMKHVFVALIPYFFFLASFGIFVLWNGSVVLGHKEFHSAGLHLPQMLYIWPYFMFFSWPTIALPRVMDFLVSRSYNVKSLTKALPRPAVAVSFIASMLLTVHFNTIVHPFTLADNRHYVFYVFRILLGHPAIKYIVTPIYFICGWAVLTSFGPSAGASESLESPQSASVQRSKRTTTKSRKPTEIEQLATAPRNPVQTPHQVQVSFVLIWLGSTSLSLVTAPLVEPRYFIIPWVIWRLHVGPIGGEKARYIPLLLEALWFTAVNAATGYVFLYKGFEWAQEPGKVQRFMW